MNDSSPLLHPAKGSSTPGTSDFRERVRAFLAEHLPPSWRGLGDLAPEARSAFLPQWREKLRDHGFLAIAWPEEYGGAGLSVMEQAVVQEEFVYAGAPILPLRTDPFGFTLLGQTLLHWGTDAQRAYFLPRIISGEHRWAQGYSEPEAGSDLFSLRTRADLQADEWVLNGQKVWQTAGDHANWLFVLARTEPDQPRARGLSLLLVPTDQPGVDVRPIRTMTGDHEFTEVFFTDARTSAQNVVGRRGQGAEVALTLLGYERGAASGAVHAGFRLELERLIDVIRTHHRHRAGEVRSRVARCWSDLEVIRCLGFEVLARAASGAAPGPESSLLKLRVSEYHARVTELAMDVLGVAGTVGADEAAHENLGPAPLGASNAAAIWQRSFLTARAGTIYGGSSQIQKNTLGERVLGLPGEPRSASS